MICPNCGTDVQDKKFCGNCGTAVEVKEEKIEIKKVFCPNCGKEVLDGNKFCESCGTDVENYGKPVVNKVFCPNCGNDVTGYNACGNCGTIITPVQQVNMPKQTSETFNNIKKFLFKYKLPIGIVCGVIFLVILGFVLYNKFYDFTKLSWDEKGDYKVSYTETTTLSLSVTAQDKEGYYIDDIKFKADGGKVTSDGTDVSWELPKKKGKYTITAEAPSGKKIKKSVTVVELKEEDETTGGYLVASPKDEDDSDADGLNNGKEKELKTDPFSKDTDNDGLSDFYEINESKTDPLKIDTDGDKLYDGDELDLGLDPLKTDSKGDGINDGERKLSYTTSSKQGVSLIVNGKGNIASTTIDVFNNDTLNNTVGVVGTIYNLSTKGTVENATVAIKYNPVVLRNRNINENNLTLFRFDDKTKKLELVPTVVNKNTKVVSANISVLSKYVLGDKNAVLTDSKTQVMFVIDNSVSMYTENQMIKAGYKNSTGAVGNDSEFKRLTLTNKLIDMFSGNYEFGVSEFSGNYVNLKKFSNDTKDIKSSVSSMESKWKSNMSGTAIIKALNGGINEFETDKNSHYLVLLTDGKNTTGSLSISKNTIINNAKEKNVKVCVIGLGKEIDSVVLDEIAEQTGCDYYSASDASALDEIYSLMGADINYNYVDTDGDNTIDGMIQANSGFIVNRDGFSFANYGTDKSPNGNCFGMALFAQLRYTGNLPKSMDSIDNSKFLLSEFKTVDFKSNGYNLNNTYFTGDKNLYDFKFTTSGLDIYFGALPGDYRDRVVDKIWKIKEEYTENFKKLGFTISEKKTNDKDADFKKYESAMININSDKLKENATNDEYQLIQGIWRLFVTQLSDKDISFSANPDDAYKALIDNLNNNTPIVISINNNHAINATRYIQDNNDSSKFKIEVYDNNFPGETRYIEVTRKKFNKVQLNYTAWTNEYNYTFKYDSDGDGKTEKTTVGVVVPNVA